MKTTLVIMAAGIGSRFGGGIKQLSPVGPNGEIIMDYSVHDAVLAGFDRILFIIRRDIEEEFREVIGERLEKQLKAKQVEVAYAFQDIRDIPSGFSFPEGRTKPWGTGQAVLACKGMLDGPFAVINADDFYGREAFFAIHKELVEADPAKAGAYSMAGFILGNTLSDNGAVTRGICSVDENGYLTGVDETHNIVKKGGKAYKGDKELDVNAHVSMNFWGFSADFLDLLEEGFTAFMKSNPDPMRGEYLIPIFIGDLLAQNKVSVRVIETKDKWFGMTYKEDTPLVRAAFEKLIQDGIYRSDLFSDLA